MADFLAFLKANFDKGGKEPWTLVGCLPKTKSFSLRCLNFTVGCEHSQWEDLATSSSSHCWLLPPLYHPLKSPPGSTSFFSKHHSGQRDGMCNPLCGALRTEWIERWEPFRIGKNQFTKSKYNKFTVFLKTVLLTPLNFKAEKREGRFLFFLSSLLQGINLLWTQFIRWAGSTPKRHYYHPVQKYSTYGHHQNPNWLYVPHFSKTIKEI